MIPGALSVATTTAHKLAPFPRAPENPEHSFEANRERVLITLLALDLMLMAFFVVMNTAASFDAKRTAAVASSLAPAQIPAGIPAEIKTAAPVSGTAARAAASAQLRAAVTDVFDAFLPPGVSVSADADDGRVDLDVPGALVETDALPPAVVAGLARVMDNPPPGYRTELLIRAQEDPAKLARMAQDLSAGGIARDALSVGMLSTGQPAPVRFTFLLLQPGEETRAASMVGRP
ncbi:MAG: hypothetical protein K1X51_18625 [Rhodospirillaceae bacterium]|nr:hypothetical protein [Rhodospirillaceae bacterium]